MLFGNLFYALGRADNRQKLNLLATAFFKLSYSVARAAARREHGVYEHNDFFVDMHGEFTIVFLRFKGFFVAIHTYMPYFRRGEEGKYSVYHS